LVEQNASSQVEPQCACYNTTCTLLACVQVDYLAKRLSTLLVLPDSRQALMRLPEPLLRQLLACEAVDVEQVTELPTWVVAAVAS
jgi:hypothetical protein